MNEKTTSYDLETGILQRLRAWSDLFPGLVLLRSLRVCGSPIYVTISLIAWLLISAMLSGGQPHSNFENLEVGSGFVSLRLRDHAVAIWQAMSWSRLFLLAGACTLVASLPIAMLVRAGGLYAAGRDPGSVSDVAKLLIRRVPSLWLAALLPIACVGGLAAPLLIVGLLDRIPHVGDILTETCAIFVTPLLVLAGVIAAGAAVAVPLAWATIAIEKKQDPLDALSRGYEYVVRRPVQTAFYLGASLILVEAMSGITRAIASVSAFMSAYIYTFASGGEALPYAIRLILTQLPNATTGTAIFSLLGATYLLLRKSANQQEIEDVAVSPIDNLKNELPSLRPKA